MLEDVYIIHIIGLEELYVDEDVDNRAGVIPPALIYLPLIFPILFPLNLKFAV